MAYIGKSISGLNSATKGSSAVQQFTANGTDYSYGLIKAPLSNKYIDVFVNGVYQNKDTFTLAGSLITFNTLIPSGYSVEVVIEDAMSAIDSAIDYVSPFGFSNPIVINENHEIAAGYNMVSAGPLTISDGVEILVSTGSTWTTV